VDVGGGRVRGREREGGEWSQQSQSFSVRGGGSSEEGRKKEKLEGATR